MGPIRLLLPADLPQVLEVYRDAVLSQTPGLYSPEQVEAWAGHAERDPGVREALLRGHGVVSCAGHDPAVIEAFALLEPADRLSLLYCRGRSCRQGRSRQLLEELEQHARRIGIRRLRTEASQLSRPLLERLGWQVESEEKLIFAGAAFVRWRMIRNLP
ncbi:MAG: N-acetyltransferase family protein [Cyanobium sp.]